MADIARKTKRYPSDLTDAEWDQLASLMPKPSRYGRKPSVDLREMLNAIRYMARSAGGWRADWSFVDGGRVLSSWQTSSMDARKAMAGGADGGCRRGG